ncbi:hypothetical protein DAPPUDRAFT_312379 [Daphnia pulex]|uniref:Uncharacterized protein n=1 Tax=Daphnia pulex TaxID=6669 RepID=E9G0N2_DAPPU|nr:hypothetical protein DAPPUDRAFT_312379 [Daphnia pulex]|eukprot:EFX86935.1 hypothetical protein DAPPUDRAFT_312379 [Daphnia pulex]
MGAEICKLVDLESDTHPRPISARKYTHACCQTMQTNLSESIWRENFTFSFNAT